MAVGDSKNTFKRMSLRLSKTMFDELCYITEQRGQNYTEAIRYLIMRDYERLKREEKQEKGSD